MCRLGRGGDVEPIQRGGDRPGAWQRLHRVFEDGKYDLAGEGRLLTSDDLVGERALLFQPPGDAQPAPVDRGGTRHGGRIRRKQLHSSG